MASGGGSRGHRLRGRAEIEGGWSDGALPMHSQRLSLEVI